MHDAGEDDRAFMHDAGEAEEEESVRVETLSVRWRVTKTRSEWRFSLPDSVLRGLFKET